MTIKHSGIHIGDHKVRDDVYGLTYLRSECVFTWDNKLVPKDYFDEKHPQLTINPRHDNIAIKDARPTPEDDSQLNFGEGSAADL